MRSDINPSLIKLASVDGIARIPVADQHHSAPPARKSDASPRLAVVTDTDPSTNSTRRPDELPRRRRPAASKRPPIKAAHEPARETLLDIRSDSWLAGNNGTIEVSQGQFDSSESSNLRVTALNKAPDSGIRNASPPRDFAQRSLCSTDPGTKAVGGCGDVAHGSDHSALKVAQSSRSITARANSRAGRHTSRMETFAERVHRLVRMAEGDRALSRVLKVSDSTIRRWKREGRLPQGEKIKEAAARLHLTEDQFIGKAPLPPSYAARLRALAKDLPDPGDALSESSRITDLVATLVRQADEHAATLRKLLHELNRVEDKDLLEAS